MAEKRPPVASMKNMQIAVLRDGLGQSLKGERAVTRSGDASVCQPAKKLTSQEKHEKIRFTD